MTGMIGLCQAWAKEGGAARGRHHWSNQVISISPMVPRGRQNGRHHIAFAVNRTGFRMSRLPILRLIQHKMVREFRKSAAFPGLS